MKKSILMTAILLSFILSANMAVQAQDRKGTIKIWQGNMKMPIMQTN